MLLLTASLFAYAGAAGDPPPGSKQAKALEWLRITNKDNSVQPLDVLGHVIENYMDEDIDPNDYGGEDRVRDREKIGSLQKPGGFRRFMIR